MGQYCFLINKQKRIRTEAYKLSAGAEEVMRIEEPEKLAQFMEHCRENKLIIHCVAEHYFTDVDDDFENPYEDF